MSTIDTFETAMGSNEPIKALLGIATDILNRNEIEELHDVDVMLMDQFIDAVRNGTAADLKSFLYDILSFVDSNRGDTLKENEDGKRYFYRWEHFHDLCSIAAGNFDLQTAGKFVASRKHGADIMAILNENRDGIRPKTLAERLGISQPQIAKLLKEFEQENLIVRERHNNKLTYVKLSPSGRVYMEDKKALDDVTENGNKADKEKVPDSLSDESKNRIKWFDDLKAKMCSFSWN